MADSAVAQIAVPCKPPASIESVLLTLTVPDHDSVAALLQKTS
jgi:hypothetical protein